MNQWFPEWAEQPVTLGAGRPHAGYWDAIVSTTTEENEEEPARERCHPRTPKAPAPRRWDSSGKVVTSPRRLSPVKHAHASVPGRAGAEL